MSRKFVVNVNGKDYDVEVTEVSSSRPVERIKEQPAAPVGKPIIEKAPAAPAAPIKAALVSEPIGGTKVTSPMPGTVLKINTEQGAKVKSGDVLLILEAMKMENEITAPSDGTVAAICVEKGGRVNSGDTLIILE